jgi:hypothetical protein
MMGRQVLLAPTVLAVAFVSVPWAGAQETKPPERIAITNLKKKIDSGEKFLLIDVREDWELEQNGAIAGAIHIPMAELDARMKDIPKDAEVVFY